MSHQSSQATVKEIQNMNQIKPKLDKACFQKRTPQTKDSPASASISVVVVSGPTSVASAIIATFAAIVVHGIAGSLTGMAGIMIP